MLNGVAEVCMKIERQYEDIPQTVSEDFDDPMKEREDEDLQPLVKKYAKHATILDRRFRIREMLVSMFSDGIFADRSDWKLLDTLSFRDKEYGPADLFVYQSDSYGTISILTLTEIDASEEVYSNLQQIHEHVVENADPIGQDMADRQGSRGSDQPLDIAPKNAEGALVLANEDPRSAVEGLKQKSELKTSVWEFSGPEDEEISVVDLDGPDNWEWYVPNNRLGTLLEEGQQYADQFQVSIDRFYDSHHELLVRQLPAFLHQHHNRSAKVWYCSEGELTEFLSKSWSSPKRDEVRPRAEALIDWWDHIGFLKKEYEGGEHYHEREAMYSLNDYNGHKTDPSDVWNEVVEPYRLRVAKAILRANRKSQFVDVESNQIPLIGNAEDIVVDG